VLSFPSSVRLFLSREPVDCRKAIDGLCQVVRDVFGDDPFSGAYYLFFNRRRNRLKVLAWDENGFWLSLKRLERGTFGVLDVARRAGSARVPIDRAELMILLEGIDRRTTKFRKHFARSARPSPRDAERAGIASR
jgi:transposase